MPNILTITFSPCIDKNTTVEELVPDQKLVCTPPVLEPGGGGINVARAIKKLGGEATALFPSGGFTGKHFNHLLEAENISTLIVSSSNETRENIIVLEKKLNKQYRLGMPGTLLLTEEWEACLSLINLTKGVEYIVASGSLPPGVPLDIYGKIAKIAKEKNARFIVDTSGPALQHALTEGVYLLKPNLSELCFLSGKTFLNEHEIAFEAKKIIQQQHAEIIVVSMGPAGAMLVTETILQTFVPPKVIRKSTVGAGDSMVAGMVYYLSIGKNIIESVRYGVACGTAATLNPGTALCNKEDVENLYGSII
jgi:6-phosphofructokinase 2